MAKLTKFTKVASGGPDKGAKSLNGFGMIPVIQRSDTVTSAGSTTLGAVPADGADILEVRVRNLGAVTGTTNASYRVDFGNATDASAYGSVSVSAAGDYVIDAIAAGNVGDATDATAATAVLMEVNAAVSGQGAPNLRGYVTYLQPLADS